MADRHKLAAQIDGMQDLKKLALLLTAAVTDCEVHGIVPAVDPAVMVICYQIAFAGNGDSLLNGYYQKLYQFCLDNQDIPSPKEQRIENPH